MSLKAISARHVHSGYMICVDLCFFLIGFALVVDEKCLCCWWWWCCRCFCYVVLM